MKTRTLLLALLCAPALSFVTTACDSHAGEKTGEAIDEAADDVGDAVEDAADEVEDAADGH